jgi:hypothetical protein
MASGGSFLWQDLLQHIDLARFLIGEVIPLRREARWQHRNLHRRNEFTRAPITAHEETPMNRDHDKMKQDNRAQQGDQNKQGQQQQGNQPQRPGQGQQGGGQNPGQQQQDPGRKNPQPNETDDDK